jgi:hypothetical protein
MTGMGLIQPELKSKSKDKKSKRNDIKSKSKEKEKKIQDTASKSKEKKTKNKDEDTAITGDDISAEHEKERFRKNK